ncbi:uncharacterized protein LOC115757652 isoform X2 [Rhodamnia argentea]|uniref:Uncharacterized protein LOC115757652 isoform X2 n=1 Tax=Rhodamnia argentea TaxID=178133 RepID=A0A8B8MMT1_9MYRT|nr:uncharacterized protein LOC115757652 isoform X2 [Rhodamnia argentea]
MASPATPSEATDGPVLSLINKRLRGLRKKHNRIVQMEESIAQGKPIHKEQEDFFRSKPSVLASIDELEKLRPQLSAALQEELSLAAQHLPRDDDAPAASEKQQQEPGGGGDAVVKDVLNLLYFGSMFAVSSQSDYTSTMLTRTHERGCCLTYDYVTDEATDLLKERDLDLIATLSSLLISRPADSSLSHKNALQKCVHHAQQWIANSDEPIEPDSSVTYASLRERLNKIIASDYFTTTPEMKAPVDMAAAAASGNYAPFQVPVTAPVQVESEEPQYEQKEEAGTEFQGREDNESNPVDDAHKEEVVADNPSEFASAQEENVYPQVEEPNQREREQKDHQYIPRRNYQNQRGGRGGGNSGRRGYLNGRGGRSGGRGGGPYQNGRGHYYEQPSNYYPRNYYNNRGRGGRGGVHTFNNHGPAVHGDHAPADVGVAS